jgi:hypothetical protein
LGGPRFEGVVLVSLALSQRFLGRDAEHRANAVFRVQAVSAFMDHCEYVDAVCENCALQFAPSHIALGFRRNTPSTAEVEKAELRLPPVEEFYPRRLA